MLFCQAYPVKKMVPLDRLANANPCLSGEFDRCPLYLDLLARTEARTDLCQAAPRLTPLPLKEVLR